jgi:2-amino-4-hydroxy-6-hydroxymethyldihydropteridine diphosphokinase
MKYYLGLGGNLGDSRKFFRQALELIEKKGLGKVGLKSALYQTEPVDAPGQPWYWNAAVLVESGLEPEAMMAGLLAVEAELGRSKDRKSRNQARSIDLDILLADDIIIKTPELSVPHPRMAQRKFALEPLLEIAPDAVHPVLKKKIGDLLKETGDKSQVKKTGERL